MKTKNVKERNKKANKWRTENIKDTLKIYVNKRIQNNIHRTSYIVLDNAHRLLDCWPELIPGLFRLEEATGRQVIDARAHGYTIIPCISVDNRPKVACLPFFHA